MNKGEYKMKDNVIIKILVSVILVIIVSFGVIVYNVLNETSEEEMVKQGTSKPATIQDRRNALKSVF